ncbi:lipid-A-disaccharide synthase [Picosynechococcus sp. PCC 8807]|uniref:lipid-A-disaccharide synthase n=1 Tax=Picosynechococcus sp. PCC 8807 TaxID=195248 RepID=UPI00081067B4|nr:lipid-A-disaccharide synthase [Picosynechococcus sp. PCC 8807]ANV89497.1 lipid-A-disaccharide synthase [Picosynechococcus sp. PCC 8807]
MAQPFDLIILTNGPGEVTTWLRPVVQAVRAHWGSLPRISVVLAPCSHSTGQEAAIARSYPEVDRVQAAKHFFPFLLWGKTAESWSWFSQGVVLFLGGDQFFPLVIGKRLGFKSLIYAEWEARWWRWIDGFGVMNAQVLEKIPPKYQAKFQVVGDLMVDISQKAQQTSTPPIVGLLPGSKGMKLAQGVPLLVATASVIRRQRPAVKFLLPVAPTITVQTLLHYGDRQRNPIVKRFAAPAIELCHTGDQPYLQVADGTQIQLITDFPAHQDLRQCQLCLTTVGANTAELGALGLPMLVLLPTQQLDAMRAWDGIPGLIAKIPWLGTWFVRWLNRRIITHARKHRVRYAWPNIWAKKDIVPELLGELDPETLGALVLDYLDHPEKLTAMQASLQACRGEAGAAHKLTLMIGDLLHLTTVDLGHQPPPVHHQDSRLNQGE